MYKRGERDSQGENPHHPHHHLFPFAYRHELRPVNAVIIIDADDSSVPAAPNDGEKLKDYNTRNGNGKAGGWVDLQTKG